MTVYRADGTELLHPADWPHERAEHPMPEVPKLTFTRDRDHLVIYAAGDGVTLDRNTIRAIGIMMVNLANDIEAEDARNLAEKTSDQ